MHYDIREPFLFIEQLHKDVQVFGSDVPTIEFVRAISAARQLLLPMPAGASNDTRHILFDPHYDSYTAHRGTYAHCR